LLGLLVLPEPNWFGKAQGEPRFEIPRQRRDQHVGVVADQIIEGSVQSANGVELSQNVLLLATVVGVKDDFLGRAGPVVGQIVEVPVVVEKLLLPRLSDLEDLADNDQPIVSLTGDGAIFRFRDPFRVCILKVGGFGG
jgi:hypothetical protein